MIYIFAHHPGAETVDHLDPLYPIITSFLAILIYGGLAYAMYQYFLERANCK